MRGGHAECKQKVITASVMCIEALLSQDAGMLEVYVVSKADGKLMVAVK